MSSFTGPQPPHDAPCVWHDFCNFLPYLYIFTILLRVIWNIYKSATTVTWNDAPCVCLAVWINHLCVMHWETKIIHFFHPCPLFAGVSVEFTNMRKLCFVKCLLLKIPHYYFFDIFRWENLALLWRNKSVRKCYRSFHGSRKFSKPIPTFNLWNIILQFLRLDFTFLAQYIHESLKH